MKRTILTLLAALSCALSFAQEKATYLVAHRDTCDLFMDVYEPVAIPGDTLDRPTILFVFGGDFIMGQRDDPWVMPWFKLAALEASERMLLFPSKKPAPNFAVSEAVA